VKPDWLHIDGQTFGGLKEINHYLRTKSAFSIGNWLEGAPNVLRGSLAEPIFGSGDCPTEEFAPFNLKIRAERPVYTNRKSQSPWPRPPEHLGPRWCLRWRLRLRSATPIASFNRFGREHRV